MRVRLTACLHEAHEPTWCELPETIPLSAKLISLLIAMVGVGCAGAFGFMVWLAFFGG